METRNASYLNSNASQVFLEVNHPEYGWVPFTWCEDPADEGEDTYGIAEWVRGLIVGRQVSIQPYAPATPQPTPVPPEVSRFQARAALLQTGFLADVQAYMDDPATDPFVRIAWQDAQVFKRQSPTVLSLQPLLGLTDEQLDDLFRFAATISA